MPATAAPPSGTAPRRVADNVDPGPSGK